VELSDGNFYFSCLFSFLSIPIKRGRSRNVLAEFETRKWGGVLLEGEGDKKSVV